MSVEPYGIIFTNGDNDTFPLWYLQEAEGIRRDVTVLVGSYLNTAWYVRQLRDLTRPCEPGQDPDAYPTRILCQRPYTAENTDAMYTHDPAEAERPEDRDPPGLAGAEPERGCLPEALDDVRIAQVARNYARLEEGRTFSLGPVTASMRSGQTVFHGSSLRWRRSATRSETAVYFSSASNPAAPSASPST